MSEANRSAEGKPIGLTRAEEALYPSTSAPPPNAPVDPNSPKCIACGRYHGGINEKFRCMTKEIERLREDNTHLTRVLRLERLGREPKPYVADPSAPPPEKKE